MRNIGNDLTYMRNRFYMPSTGRFYSEDPIGLAGGDVSFYRYVGNDPVSFIDPEGLIGYSDTINDVTMNKDVAVTTGIMVGGTVGAYYSLPYIAITGTGAWAAATNLSRRFADQTIATGEFLSSYVPSSTPVINNAGVSGFGTNQFQEYVLPLIMDGLGKIGNLYIERMNSLIAEDAIRKYDYIPACE